MAPSPIPDDRVTIVKYLGGSPGSVAPPATGLEARNPEETGQKEAPRTAPPNFPDKGISGMRTPETSYANDHFDSVKVKLPTVTPPTKDPSVTDFPDDDDSLPSLTNSRKSGGYTTPPEEAKSFSSAYEELIPETVSESSTRSSSVHMSRIPPPPDDLDLLLVHMLTHFGDVPHLAPNGLPNLVKSTLGCQSTYELVETLKLGGNSLVQTYGQESI